MQNPAQRLKKTASAILEADGLVLHQGKDGKAVKRTALKGQEAKDHHVADGKGEKPSVTIQTPTPDFNQGPEFNDSSKKKEFNDE